MTATRRKSQTKKQQIPQMWLRLVETMELCPLCLRASTTWAVDHRPRWENRRRDEIVALAGWEKACRCPASDAVELWTPSNAVGTQQATSQRIGKILKTSIGLATFQSNLYCNKKAVLSQRWPRDARYISRSWAVAEIWPFEIIQDGGGRHLEIVRIENSTIRSAVPENPTLEQYMKWIGRPVAEISPLEIFPTWRWPPSWICSNRK